MKIGSPNLGHISINVNLCDSVIFCFYLVKDAGISSIKIILPNLGIIFKGNLLQVFNIITLEKDQLEKLLLDDIQNLIYYPISVHKLKICKYFSNISYPFTDKIYRVVLNMPKMPMMRWIAVLKIIYTTKKL